jgi:surface antigen
MLMAVVVPISMLQTAHADQYDERIKALESQIAGFQSEASRLAGEAASLKQAVDNLTAQKNTIQAQLDLSQAKYDKLVADIAANEKKLQTQQGVLTSIVSLMVSDEQVTPIEILASSSSVGDYVAKQDQLTATSGQLQSSIEMINAVKADLAKQKSDVEKVLADQKSQRDSLAAKEAEQASLLAATQSQESAYQNLMNQSAAKIAEERANQAAANARANYNNLVSGGSGCGGYPAVWCNAAQDSLVDNWGMYNRECVSYTAWKVASTGRYMPYWGGRGNAKEWPSSARTDGIATGYTPQAGAVAILMSGYYGHAMYVERVNSNGTVHVSQFNWLVNGQWGRYSEMDIASSGLIYIYF